MKLIGKTLLYYLLISLPLLVIAGVFCYWLIGSELQEGVDESLAMERNSAEQRIRSMGSSQTLAPDSDKSSVIEPVDQAFHGERFSDTSMYDPAEEECVDYRVLQSGYTYNGRHYRITISKTTLEEEELMEGLFSAFGVIVGFLVVAFFLVNWLLSKTLWKPFHRTLQQLNRYDLRDHALHRFEPSTTTEFQQLTVALNNMTEKMHSDFLQQKEFTENASHEMQTPLAIVAANVSLLMQSPNLREDDMNQLQAIENTLKKLNALNKTLLLLTKIDNHQFPEHAVISIRETVEKVLDQSADFLQVRGLQLETDLQSDLRVAMNPVLADVLVSNLLQNAIRHNREGGSIRVAISGQTLSVANTGDPLTILPEELFLRFKKNDASKDSLGLGLSIVKSIADTYDFEVDYAYREGWHEFVITIH